MHKFLEHLTLHDLMAGHFFQRPNLHLVAGDFHCGCARLLEKQRSLTEKSIFPQRAHNIAIYFHDHLTTCNNIERRSNVALGENCLPLSVHCEHKCSHERMRLLLREVSEDWDLLHEQHLADPERRLLCAAAMQLLQGLGEDVPSQHLYSSSIGTNCDVAEGLALALTSADLLIPITTTKSHGISTKHGSNFTANDNEQPEGILDRLPRPVLFDQHGLGHC
mmetsp:Transcript_59109/g.103453  ORF Transcript_59109/g.103453 Transcript_59109/m.103453 type:complete len:221 (+) Transcript_59109:1069-1731(+)